MKNIITKFEKFILENYKNYITVIGAFNYDNKILILKRGSTAPWMPNKWSLVGGVVEEGEDFESALIRESEEETGLIPINLKKADDFTTDEMGRLIFYTGDLDSEDVVLDYENSDYAFIDKSTYLDYHYVPSVKEFLEKLFN